MDGRIIAGRFIQSKAKGDNGKFSTHLVDDPLSGERVVVKVFADEEPLALEYLKGMNVLNDHGCRGMALPLESGMMEEEPGYYQAFPEIPGPTLEEYLTLNPSMDGRELERLVRELEDALHDLHAAGFLHLFLAPRNIFYSPGRPVITKDPALTCPHYSFFMQELQGFDYPFFSPRLMDGGEGGPEEDLYSLGRVALHVLEKVDWVGDEASRGALLERAVEMTGGGGRPAQGTQVPAGSTSAQALPEIELTGQALPVETLDAAPLEDGAGEAGGPRDPGVEVREVSLEGLSLEEAGGRGAGSGLSGVRRRPGRPLRAVALILMAACALAVLAYGLPARSDGGPASPGLAANVDREEEESGGLPREEREPAATTLEDTAASPFEQGAPGEPEQASPAADPGTAVSGQGSGATAVAAKEAPPANQRPVASFSASPSEGGSPLRVYLDASSSYDPDGDIVSYQWSCGGSGVAVYRVFEGSVIPARISITLTVTDSGGASASTARVITLY